MGPGPEGGRGAEKWKKREKPGPDYITGPLRKPSLLKAYFFIPCASEFPILKPV